MSSVTSIPAVQPMRGIPLDTPRGVTASAGERPVQVETGFREARPVTQIESSETAVATKQATTLPREYSEEEKRQIVWLKERDAEVRAHEQAHKSVGGRYAGSISYDMETGPDGEQYAIGGSVPIDTSPDQSVEATISKMEIVIAAALAPRDPSPEDHSIANLARKHLLEAQAQLRLQDMEERRAMLDAMTRSESPTSDSGAPTTFNRTY